MEIQESPLFTKMCDGSTPRSRYCLINRNIEIQKLPLFTQMRDRNKGVAFVWTTEIHESLFCLQVRVMKTHNLSSFTKTNDWNTRKWAMKMHELTSSEQLNYIMSLLFKKMKDGNRFCLQSRVMEIHTVPQFRVYKDELLKYMKTSNENIGLNDLLQTSEIHNHVNFLEHGCVIQICTVPSILCDEDVM